MICRKFISVKSAQFPIHLANPEDIIFHVFFHLSSPRQSKLLSTVYDSFPLKSTVFRLLVVSAHGAPAIRAVAVNVQLMTGNCIIRLFTERFLVRLQRAVFDGQNFFTAEADEMMPVGHPVHFEQRAVVARYAEPRDDFFLCQKIERSVNS